MSSDEGYDIETIRVRPVKTKQPPYRPQSSPGWNLDQPWKAFRFFTDKDRNVWTYPVVITDPNQPEMLPAGVVHPYTDANTVQYGLATFSQQALLRPGATDYVELERTPTVFKNVTVLNNGATVLWHPSATDLRWRLMGIQVTILKATTAAGACKLSILDAAADTGIGVDICAAAMTAVPGGLMILSLDLKNGFLAAAVHTDLNASLSSALAAGGLSIQVWGTEE